ncbi:hypothetical protein Gotur_004736 [Gossypium turneri]
MGRPHIPAPVLAPTPSHTPALVPPPAHYNNSLVSPGQYGQPSPGMLQPMIPGDAIWANTAESPISAYVLLPNPPMSALPSPRGVNGAVPQMPNPPSQQMNGSIPLIPMNGPALLPSPTSQFLWPSLTGFMNLLSPRSTYSLISPGVQFPPMTPNFAFSPIVQPEVLGPGPQPPPSSGFVFPLSPSGFFPFPSPRWSDYQFNSASGDHQITRMKSEKKL